MNIYELDEFVIEEMGLIQWYSILYESRYDYTNEGSDMVEDLHDQYLFNKRLAMRYVKSGTFVYAVDLDNMTQTNSSTGKVREIRRNKISQNNAGYCR